MLAGGWRNRPTAY